MNFTLQQIAAYLKADIKETYSNRNINTIVYDTRLIFDCQHAIFVALRHIRDGHNFIADAYRKGIRNFIVENRPLASDFPHACFIEVEDVIEALHLWAAAYRKHLSYPIVGITGSNGKTIVKEWLKFLIAERKNVAFSPLSFNSQLGVALSILSFPLKSDIGIVEAGISQEGEMARLEKIIQPDIVILTCIGATHDIGFKNRLSKIKEKLILSNRAKTLVYNPNHIKERGLGGKQNYFTWSIEQQKNTHTNLYVYDIYIKQKRSYFQVQYDNKQYQGSIPFIDKASVENSIICMAFLLLLKFPISYILEKLTNLPPIAMRMKWVKGTQNCILIDDSYSNDPIGLSNALNVLSKHKKRCSVILSDIIFHNKQTQAYLVSLSKKLKQLNIKNLVGIGKHMLENKHLFVAQNTYFYNTTKDFLSSPKVLFNDEVILIKGSRVFQFEKIVAFLSQKKHQTQLQINLSAIEDNLNFFRSKLKPSVKIMAVVKALNYGLSSWEIASYLENKNIDYLAVAYSDEAVIMRRNGIQLPIMILNTQALAFDDLIKYKLEPSLYSLSLCIAFEKFLINKGIFHYPVHLKIETGMNRLGIDKGEFQDLLLWLKDNKRIKVHSVFSHLAASLNPSKDFFSMQQMSCFKQYCKQIENTLQHKVVKHIANSSAILRFPQSHLDMVRIGIGLLGLVNIPKYQKYLSSCLKLSTFISQVKQVENINQRIGYGANCKLEKIPGQIAIAPIGYADGFAKSLGNSKIHLNLNDGTRVLVIGEICMDMTFLDVTEKKVLAGDPLIVFDSNEQIWEMSKKMHTTPYEFLTRFASRIKKVYVINS